jgi:hypothetical protein
MNAARQLLVIAVSFCLVFSGVVEAAGGSLRGHVVYAGLPVPGVKITASQNETTQIAVTDAQGGYSFSSLAEGAWKIDVEMSGFAKQTQDLNAAESGSTKDFELTMLPIAEMHAQTVKLHVAGAAQALASRMELKAPAGAAPKPDQPKEAATNGPAPPAPPEAADSDLNRRSADGLLINGSVNNGAASPFSQMQAFGNNRSGGRSLYNGNLGFTMDHSVFDAGPYSLTGQATPKPQFYHMQGLASLGGPLRIPHLLRNGPQIFVNYQWVRNRTATTQSVLMPTTAQREGDFSQTLNPLGQQVTVIDPATGQPFAGNIVPLSRISPQAQALLKLFPSPNFAGSSQYNFQTPLVSDMHQDSLQARAMKGIGRKNYLSGMFALQSTRTDTPNVFGFLDTGHVLGINTNINWRHTLAPRFFATFGVQFSRQSTLTNPFFANRENVSGAAGITETNQNPQYWGPPALNFTGGIAGLNDAQFSNFKNQTMGTSYESFWSRGKHNISFGGDFRRQQFNTLAQQDPRGTFTFTGAATGSDFAGFLLGIPDTTSIAYGNADKYFRSNLYDLFVNDDFRLRPGLTLNAGVRWDYNSPISEEYGRLVNLNTSPGFGSATPVVGPRLINPEKHNISPRVSLAWRPLPASSMVIRAGYGVYYDTSVYQSIANMMAQQAPLSTSLRIPNTAALPLTLAQGFPAAAVSGTNATTFGIDPNFRLGYAQNWQVAIQRDLPFALQVVATYLGIKGTRGIQDFLPNTYPTGAVNPCPTCPSGFTYMTSNGNSTRESGIVQLRRRLRSGFASELAYTYSKSIDDAALGARGSYLIAQNWLDLSAERGRSNFDQRQLLALQMQYTSGMGIHGGGLVSGWRGAMLKEWTFTTQITAGTGLPLTPTYPAAVAGTGVTGSIRPDYTGASLYNAPNGLALNPAAYTIPAAGYWGNAGRNTITGPGQFALNANMSRTFRLTDRFSGDLRIDATNALNHPTFPSWNTVITSNQFGLPTTANAMRSIVTTFRVRF